MHLVSRIVYLACLAGVTSAVTRPLGDITAAYNLLSDDTDALSISMNENYRNQMSGIRLQFIRQAHYSYVKDNSCDRVVIVDHGGLECKLPTGCSLLSTEKFEGSFFGSDYYYCRGHRNSLEQDELGEVEFLKIVTAPSVIARTKTKGVEYSLFLDNEQTDFWDSFTVMRLVTNKARTFLVPTVCISDGLPSISSLAGGQIMGDEFVFDTLTPVANCSLDGILELNSMLLAGPDRHSISLDYIDALMAISLPVKILSSSPFEGTFGAMYCNKDDPIYPISITYALMRTPQKVKGLYRHHHRVCRLQDPPKREIRIPAVRLSRAWYEGLVDLMGKTLAFVAVDVVEPIINTCITVIWSIVKEAFMIVVDTVLNSTALTSVTLVLALALALFSFFYTRNLTSPCINVTLTDETFEKLLRNN